MENPGAERALGFGEVIADALSLLDGDFVDEALELLSTWESQTGAHQILENRSLAICGLDRVSLQRASILRDLGRFHEALPILERVRSNSFESLSRDESGLSEASKFNLLFSTLELAQLLASEGLLNAAIRTVEQLSLVPDRYRDIPEELRYKFLVLVDFWGQSLGYDDLSERLGIDFEVSTEPPPYPVSALRGFRYGELESNFVGLSEQLSESATDDIEGKRSLLNAMVTAAERWVERAKYSLPVRESLVRTLIARAELEIKTEHLEEFGETFAELELPLNELLADSAEDPYLRLKLAGSFLQLSNAILFHKFESEEVWAQHYGTATGVLSIALNLLDEIRGASAVTQAVALRTCLVFNLAALSEEMVDEDSKAHWFRSRRDAILAETLRLDPANDLGHRLVARFEPTRVEIDRTAAKDIAGWRWSVEPLI